LLLVLAGVVADPKGADLQLMFDLVGGTLPAEALRPKVVVGGEAGGNGANCAGPDRGDAHAPVRHRGGDASRAVVTAEKPMTSRWSRSFHDWLSLAARWYSSTIAGTLA
jgi:hypothetical protein